MKRNAGGVLKGCLIATGVAVVLVVAIVILAFMATAGLPEAADGFLSAAAKGDYATASGFLAEEFKASTPEPELKAFLESSTLNRYAKATWNNRSIENNKGVLQGTVTTRDGGTVPVSLTLVKEKEAWKILLIEKDASGLTESKPLAAAADKPAAVEPAATGGLIPVPPEKELIALVQGVMAEFDKAIKANDFTALHAKASKPFQKQLSPDQLRESFKEFVEQELDLSSLADLQPLFDEAPRVDEEGKLRLKGHYATSPATLSFSMEFYERPDWKLIGLKVNVK